MPRASFVFVLRDRSSEALPHGALDAAAGPQVIAIRW